MAFYEKSLVSVIENINSTLRSAQLNERTWTRETKTLLQLASEFVNLRTRQTQVENGMSDEAEIETAGSLYLLRHDIGNKMNSKCEQLATTITRMRNNLENLEIARNTIAMANDDLLVLPIPQLHHASIANILQWWRQVYAAYCAEYTLMATAADEIVRHSHATSQEIAHVQLLSILSHPFLATPALRQTRGLLHAVILPDSDNTVS